MTTTDATPEQPPQEPDPTTPAAPLIAIAALVAAGALIAAIIAFSGRDDTSDPIVAPDPVTPISHEVLYEVDGSTDWAEVTIHTPTGIRQFSPDVPMTRTNGERGLPVTVDPGTPLVIVAQNNRGYGTITCRITVDGRVVAENRSRGGYAVVSCEATAGS
jgi:hypothetical protein